MIKLIIIGLLIYGVFKYFGMANKQLEEETGRKKVKSNKGPINIQININKGQKKDDDYIDYEDVK